MKPIVVLSCILGIGVTGTCFFLYTKHTEKVKVLENYTFLDGKLNTISSELKNYLSDVAALQNELETANNQLDTLARELKDSETANNDKKTELDVCLGEEKQLNDETRAIEGEMKNTEDNFNKQKAAWAEELSGFQKQLSERSSVCKFVDRKSEEALVLCGEAVKTT